MSNQFMRLAQAFLAFFAAYSALHRLIKHDGCASWSDKCGEPWKSQRAKTRVYAVLVWRGFQPRISTTATSSLLVSDLLPEPPVNAWLLLSPLRH